MVSNYFDCIAALPATDSVGCCKGRLPRSGCLRGRGGPAGRGAGAAAGRGRGTVGAAAGLVVVVVLYSLSVICAHDALEAKSTETQSSLPWPDRRGYMSSDRFVPAEGKQGISRLTELAIFGRVVVIIRSYDNVRWMLRRN